MAQNTVGSSNPSRSLQNLGTGSTRDLALQMFSGLVLEAFKNKTAFYDNTGNIMTVKTLQNSHSAQFPIIGDDIDIDNTNGDNGTTKGYHTPGTFIAGDTVKMSKTSIEVDDILLAAMDVGYADLDIAHFDVLGPFAQKMGRSLAQSCDKKIAIMALNAARTGAVSGIHPGGQLITVDTGTQSITSAYGDTSAGAIAFRKDAAQLALKFDEDNVPEDGRYLFIPPYIKTILRNESILFNRDYNDPSVVGSLNNRVIGKLEGFNLILSNNMPTGPVSGFTGFQAKYNLSMTVTDQVVKSGSFVTGALYEITTASTTTANNATNFPGASAYTVTTTFTATGPGTTDLTAAAKIRSSVTQPSGTGVPAAIALCGAIEGSAAVGMVQAAGIRSVIQDDERRNTKFMKSQMMVGFGVLSPWCAGAIELV